MESIQMTESFNWKMDDKILLDAFMENSTDAVWVRDAHLNLLKANQNYYEIFKNSDSKVFKFSESDVLKNLQPTTSIVASQDKEKLLSISAIPIVKDSKLDFIMYIARDITEQETVKEMFFVSKYQLDSLLRNVPKIIYLKDLKGHYITGTKYSRELFEKGYDSFYDIQLDLDVLNTYRVSDDEIIIKENEAMSYDREFFDVNGTPHWYNIYKTPITDSSNKVMGIVVMSNNIDEEKLLQAQRETFVATLGHDLKNPTLAQIRALELLLKGEFGNITDSQKEILDMVLDSCRYMNAMLSSLLATYKTDKGTVKLNYDYYSLLEISKECVSEMLYLAKDKNVLINIEDKSNNAENYMDKVQIKRVVMNLLSNAIKYAYKNTSVDIVIYEEDDSTCFSIENHSSYIKKQDRDAIFARYVTFAEAHNELGIGLGLYASKKIVSSHGGVIYVESFKDERNIFVFKIPTSKLNKSETVSF